MSERRVSNFVCLYTKQNIHSSREIWNRDGMSHGLREVSIRFSWIVIFLQYCSCNGNVMLRQSPNEMTWHSWFSLRAEGYGLNYRTAVGSVPGLRGRFLSMQRGIPAQHASSSNWKDINRKLVTETSRELGRPRLRTYTCERVKITGTCCTCLSSYFCPSRIPILFVAKSCIWFTLSGNVIFYLFKNFSVFMQTKKVIVLQNPTIGHWDKPVQSIVYFRITFLPRPVLGALAKRCCS